ncbi:protein-L-isoaspartate O-methyltransferase [Devosia sp. ZB163]|uniref:protein-L-isoaspartate O-methyltransferase family protein n=1 Tax=Devosia sp. ZB163 TaxID=3025938 RepID=UPI00235E77EB|nr:protein-L-isoaspartate O-methyltransferase [Devosia sp. ZB163]MDC9824281.1 protein-L-isoaspartate O-methyltransferase [Devosia sp. ZB163]
MAVDFAAARLKMVDNQLRTSNVTDHRVLAAIGEVPRELFVPANRAALAYADVVHHLGGDRYLAAPAPFAKLLQLAEITEADRILDVGAGTGYSTAVLSQLGSEVTALEPDTALAERAESNLRELGVTNATVAVGPLNGSSLLHSHFDVVVVEGEVRSEPTELTYLLRDGGRLVVVIAGNGPGVAHVFVKSGGEVAGRSEFNASLPPLTAPPRLETFVF